MTRLLAFGVVILLVAGMTAEAQAQRVLRGGLLGAGGGAIIGGILDGGDGAAVGAVLGGVTGLIVANERERRDARLRDEGFYFNSKGRCYYEHPNGDVVLVKHERC